ncbi:aldo/keto reductase [Tropicimonas sp. TH_r6]|uniref:aldo/keto reductase n=1 Tax=Tropicimonas sp. TH_r6 TaxID=3082085 RepID=UPI00295487B5|nr:aldo/keto reductase [Tropicimonas sp. TH_r6]MDV7145820.1 aldo/keto reductase [Tropicimonas sp. TH_r6]
MAGIRMINGIPQIGFGTWNRDGQVAYDTVRQALDVGYRHIDTAEGYKNEEFVGAAIADSGIDRADIFLTTKVSPESFGPGQIMSHARTSLDKLRVEHVDLLLLHYPSIGDEYEIEDYMGQFAEVFDAGLTERIGVSNFTKRYIDRALELLGDRPIATNQVEIHPLMQNRPIVEHCRDRGISLTAYSPLGRGCVNDSAGLKEIAAEHGATAAQIALAFLMAEGFIVIPSSGNQARIAENFVAKDFALTEAEIATIRTLDEGRRLVDGPWCPAWDTN